MQVFTIGLAAFAVSFVFAMMGAGGSQILVPILFWLGLDFKTGAIPLGLLASAVTLFSAGGIYFRRGLVRIKTAIPFALAVLVAAPLGAIAARPTSSTTLMVVFALVNIAVGLLVFRGRSMVSGELSRRRELTLCLVIGLGVGFLIGFIARDGGPFTMAILVLIGFEAKEAAGTAPVIVAAGCLVAFIVHAFDMTAAWTLVLAVILASLLGSQLGARYMSGRMESRNIRILFTAVMILVGVVILIQAF
jgi:uncharacterized membrane protein YfcA